MGFYLHSTPGRLRLKIPGLKRNVELADELLSLLRERRGVESLEINALTGSVKINFDESVVNPSALLNLLSQEGHVDLTKLVSSTKYTDTLFSEAGMSVSKAILGLALDRAFKSSSLSILTALI